MTAPFTLDKRLTLANSQDGDEKEREIIIHADKIGLIQPAVGTDAGMALDFFPFRAHTPDENHEFSPSSFSKK